MSELQQALFTSLLTVLGGTVLLVLGQLVTRFYFDSVIEQRKAIAQVHHLLRFYSNFITSPGLMNETNRSDLGRQLREASVSLQVSTAAIPTYRFLESWGSLIPRPEITSASSELMLLSISLVQGEELANFSRIRSILATLRLPSV